MYNEIIKRKNDGLINVRKHPFLDLEICNYTQKTQYERQWDKYTKMCRGLILDADHNIISRPFQKFFNLGEVEETQIANLPDELPAFSEKLDGVLGILYPENDKVAIASRGSFDSEYALWATEWVREKGYRLDDFREGYTYLFEIIYPGSKIVVNYKGRSELVLLAVLNNEGKKELDHIKEAKELGFSFAEEYNFETIEDAKTYLESKSGLDQEGFVCKYTNGLRVKIKSSNYFGLHRLLQNITGGSFRKEIIKCLSEGESIDKHFDVAPDEMFDEIRSTEQEILQAKNDLELQAKTIFEGASKLQTRKEQAMYIKNYPRLQSVVFCMLDGKHEQAEEGIWKILSKS